jgi:hypothetical protein
MAPVRVTRRKIGPVVTWAVSSQARIAFTALSDRDVLKLTPGYHPIYREADPELLLLIDDKVANGRLRSWAAFTHTAAAICSSNGAGGLDRRIAESAITQLGGG